MFKNITRLQIYKNQFGKKIDRTKTKFGREKRTPIRKVKIPTPRKIGFLFFFSFFKKGGPGVFCDENKSFFIYILLIIVKTRIRYQGIISVFGR